MSLSDDQRDLLKRSALCGRPYFTTSCNKPKGHGGPCGWSAGVATAFGTDPDPRKAQAALDAAREAASAMPLPPLGGKKLTREQYYALNGLRLLGIQHNERLHELREAFAETILQGDPKLDSEVAADYSPEAVAEDWFDDLIYHGENLDDLLKQLKVEVED
jgi:hypothetical protein